jgi:hypothetical protein
VEASNAIEEEVLMQDKAGGEAQLVDEIREPTGTQMFERREFRDEAEEYSAIFVGRLQKEKDYHTYLVKGFDN